MQLAAGRTRGAEGCAGRGASCSYAPACGASPHPRGALRSHAAAGRAAALPRGGPRACRGDAAAAGAGEPAPAGAAGAADGLSEDDASTLLTSVESDLRRFSAFEAQNEAGISRLAGIVVQREAESGALVSVGDALSGGQPQRAGAQMSPAQMARVWKARPPPPADARARAFCDKRPRRLQTAVKSCGARCRSRARSRAGEAVCAGRTGAPGGPDRA